MMEQPGTDTRQNQEAPLLPSPSSPHPNERSSRPSSRSPSPAANGNGNGEYDGNIANGERPPLPAIPIPPSAPKDSPASPPLASEEEAEAAAGERSPQDNHHQQQQQPRQHHNGVLENEKKRQWSEGVGVGCIVGGSGGGGDRKRAKGKGGKPMVIADHELYRGQHDEVCFKCGKHGTLICCDTCPRAWHNTCSGFRIGEFPPDADPWICPLCDEVRNGRRSRSGSGSPTDRQPWDRRPLVANGRRERPAAAPARRRGNKHMRDDDKAPESDDDHDSVCNLCNLHGELLCCDTCRRAFHISCLKMSSPPPEEVEWSCCYCAGTLDLRGVIREKPGAAGGAGSGGSQNYLAVVEERRKQTPQILDSLRGRRKAKSEGTCRGHIRVGGAYQVPDKNIPEIFLTAGPSGMEVDYQKLAGDRSLCLWSSLQWEQAFAREKKRRQRERRARDTHRRANHHHHMMFYGGMVNGVDDEGGPGEGTDIPFYEGDHHQALSSYLSSAKRNWLLNVPYYDEFALSVLRFAKYDIERALAILIQTPNAFNFDAVCQPPLRPYPNKWHPKDVREHMRQIPPFPPLRERKVRVTADGRELRDRKRVDYARS
ncbi:unnamed protein product [Vitrella brassicaformis CCMP3155]|uniref:PHD-type domain-containing protein n=4 Tax=Vitrella brassicaformis TaxID=1169539 RepID=A0A0G4FRI0_VITBC|nr:unnamed protein product [Vitrella brassicaformis CCMP3155]|eukprot:CEM16875.1 unnamed protein product [Vitrella brassicaformis CCMP3155]